MAVVSRCYAIPRWNSDGDCYLFLPTAKAPREMMACFTVIGGFVFLHVENFHRLLSTPPTGGARDNMYGVIGRYRKIAGPDTVVYITHKDYRKFQQARYGTAMRLEFPSPSARGALSPDNY